MTETAILFDSSKCTGCKGCQVACKCWNNLPSYMKGANAKEDFTGTYQNPPDLNGTTRLIMTFDERDGAGQKPVEWAFGRRSCMHCEDAPCATVCSGGALVRNEDTGFVEVDQSKCVGCKYCLDACPYDVPRYDGDNGILGRAVINKCTGCGDRVEHGMAPACVSTCQPQALRFGTREEMLAYGRERVEVLRGRGFADASLYGADQIGGAHVLHVLKYPLDRYELPENPEVSATVAMTQVMKPITGALSGLTVVGLAAMFGLAAGYKRDKLAYNPATKDTIDVATGAVVKHGDGQDEMSVMEHITENIGKKGGQ